MNRFLLLFIFQMAAHPLHAAGPILVDTEMTGLPVLWKDGVVRVNMESGAEGTLGSLSNDEAVALVRELFEEWRGTAIDGVATVDLILQEGTPLGSVDASNLNEHFTYCPP